MIKLPKKGYTLEIDGPHGERAYVHRCGQEWRLSSSVTTRCRWGNARIIREDIEHFQKFGRFPDCLVGGF